jgi:simple sugar transport system ATP-binding protein
MTAPALELSGVTRAFGGRIADRDVSLSVAPGELHALVGENGAGKSTAMRIAAGILRPDAGVVRIFGTPLSPHRPAQAIALGLGMVHQHFMLVDPLTVAENVVLGDEPRDRPWLDLRAAAARIEALGESLGARVDPARRAGDLGVGDRQRVEILKLLWRGTRLLILDEPTAVLAPAEARALLGTLRRLCDEGRAVVWVTHRLDEVTDHADRVTVLRRGEVVARFDAARIAAADIARAMVGGDLPPPPARIEAPSHEVRLSVRDLAAGVLAGFSLEVRGGEIVGLAGVEGNGQTDLVETVAGLRASRHGTVALDGRDVTRSSVRARREAGLAFVPEDRAAAVVPDFTLEENLRLGGVRQPAAALSRFDVQPADPRGFAGDLSGGNQQKLLLCREMSRAFSALVAAHPTRGIDVLHVRFVHERLLAARAAGKAVLLVSADLDELRSLCDRIVVMWRGALAGVLAPADATDETLGALMTGIRAA